MQTQAEDTEMLFCWRMEMRIERVIVGWEVGREGRGEKGQKQEGAGERDWRAKVRKDLGKVPRVRYLRYQGGGGGNLEGVGLREVQVGSACPRCEGG